uniref:Uncharacterized protein n=1 Tax=Tetradesmus obliquus TaxID=3088 RepID=A0A383VET3_TETOB
MARKPTYLHNTVLTGGGYCTFRLQSAATPADTCQVAAKNSLLRSTEYPRHPKALNTLVSQLVQHWGYIAPNTRSCESCLVFT